MMPVCSTSTTAEQPAKGKCRSAQALGKAMDQPDDSPDSAEAAAQIAGRLAAKLGHDLRSPLNAIAGLNEILLSGLHGPLTEKQKEYLRHMADGEARLREMIEDLVQLARGVPADAAEPESFALLPALEAAASLVREAALVCGVQVDVRGSGAPLALGDRLLVKQIVILAVWAATQRATGGDALVVSTAEHDDMVVVRVLASSAGEEPPAGLAPVKLPGDAATTLAARVAATAGTELVAKGTGDIVAIEFGVPLAAD